MAFTISPYKYWPLQIGAILEFNADKADHLGENTWSYEGKALPEILEFTIKAELPDLWEHLVPKSERKKPGISVVATVTCRVARKKYRILLKKTGNDWLGKVKLKTRELDGKLEIEIFLLLGKRIVKAEDGHAKEKCSIISTSHPISLVLRPEKDQKGGDLKTQWKKFSKLSSPACDYRKAVYYLDVIEDPPILFLNEELSDDLRQLMSVEATRGSKAMVRDAFIMPIVADVWEQLVTEALGQLNELGNLESLNKWEQGVLKTVATGLTGISGQKDAEQTLEENCLDEDFLKKLIEKKLPMYVQEKAGLAESFTKVAERELK